MNDCLPLVACRAVLFAAVLLTAAMLPLVGCDDDSPATTEGDSGDVAASDSDSDGSACVDPGSDVGFDLGTDAEPDTEDDLGTCADGGADTPGDLATDVGLDADSDTNADPDSATDVENDPESDADLNADSDADSDADADSGLPIICENTLTDARDGATYATVVIGSQCWMAENLDVGTMIAADTAQQDNGIVEKYCYNNNLSQCGAYGGLYQWNELMAYGLTDAGNPSTTQGICPTGWHVPSDEEWKTLEVALGMSALDADLGGIWRGAGIGTALKVDGSSGFEALMAGRSSNGLFGSIESTTYFYTSTESADVENNAWRRCLSASANNVGRYDTFAKSTALSLRCVRDQ